MPATVRRIGRPASRVSAALEASDPRVRMRKRRFAEPAPFFDTIPLGDLRAHVRPEATPPKETR